jgi:hypothetical protein
MLNFYGSRGGQDSNADDALHVSMLISFASSAPSTINKMEF